MPDDLTECLARRIEQMRALQAMEFFLDPRRQEAIADPYANAMTAAFFASHGARLLARARETGRFVSFVAFSFSAPTLASCAAKDMAATLRDVSLLTRRISRSEDSLFRLTANTFVMILPATNAQDAALIAGRIEGVLNSTRFKRHSGQDQTEIFFALTVTTSIYGVDPTSSEGQESPLEEIVARLLGDLRRQQDAEGDKSSAPRPVYPGKTPLGNNEFA